MKELKQIELQLSNEDPEVRINALFDAYECEEAGIKLVTQALKDRNRKVRQAALILLTESDAEIAQQALWNYLPFFKMQCLHTVTEFEFNSFDTKGFEPEYFAIADRYNSLIGYWNIDYKKAGVAIWNLATANVKKDYGIATHECGLGQKGKLLVTSYQHHSHIYETETSKEIKNYSSEYFICGLTPLKGEFVVCKGNNPLLVKSEDRVTIGKFEVWNYKTYLCSLELSFDDFRLMPSTMVIANSKLANELIYIPSLIFTPDGQLLIVRFIDKNEQVVIKIWSTNTNKLIKTIDRLPKLSIISVGVCPDGTIIACGIRESKVCAWELQTDKIIFATDEMCPCILSNNGRVLIYATANYEIAVRDLVQEQELCRLTGHNAPIAYLTLSEDYEFIASYSTDRQIKIWAIPDFKVGWALPTL